VKNQFRRPHLASFPPDLEAKWPGGVLSEGFVPFPKKLLRSLGALFGKSEELEDLAVLLAIVDFKRANQTRHPSLDFLSFVSGIPEDAVDRSISRMRSKGWVEHAVDEIDGNDVDHSKLIELIETAARESH
jgi:hypothetical protein